MKNLFISLNKLFGSNLKYFFVGLLTLVCIFLVYINASNYGIGISADSINYLSIAKNISQHFSFYTSVTEWNFEGTSYWNGYWPPLYPMLLIIPSLFGDNISFIIFNGLLLSITFILAFILVKRLNPEKEELIILIVALVIFSKWIFWIFSYLLSETVFIPLVLAFLLLLDNLVVERSDNNYLRLLFVTCLLSLTRYIGIFFFIPIVLFTLPSLFIFSIKKISYLVLAVIPFFVILFINYLKTEKLFGVRASGSSSFLELTHTLSSGITKWIFGSQSIPVLEITISLGFAAIIIFFIVIALRQKNGSNKIIVVSSLTYLIAILLSALTERLEKFGFRFISPIYIPMTLLILSFMLKLKRRIIYVVLVLLFAVSGFVLFRFVIVNRNVGIGVFATKEWESSETIGFLKKNTLDKIIYSNYAEPITFYTCYPTKIITDEKNKVELMIEKIRREHAVIVIINATSRQQPETIELIENAVSKQPQTKLADGTIYYF